MVEQGGGAIVNVASVNAFFQPDAGTIDYGAAKAALRQPHKSLAQEFGAAGHPRQLVSPGPVSTDLWLGETASPRPSPRRPASTPRRARENVVASIGGFATGRFTTPEEVATLVVLLASERTGQRDRRELRHRRRPHQDDLSLRRAAGRLSRSPTRPASCRRGGHHRLGHRRCRALLELARDLARLGSGSSAVAIRVTTPHAAM